MYGRGVAADAIPVCISSMDARIATITNRESHLERFSIFKFLPPINFLNMFNTMTTPSTAPASERVVIVGKPWND